MSWLEDINFNHATKVTSSLLVLLQTKTKFKKIQSVSKVLNMFNPITFVHFVHSIILTLCG